MRQWGVTESGRECVGRETDRQTETDRDRQNQAETDRDKERVRDISA